MKTLFIIGLLSVLLVTGVFIITPDFCTHPGNPISCHGVPCNPIKEICPL